MRYFYTYRLRGFSMGCQPSGVVEVINSLNHRYEVIVYDRVLTAKEIDDYELIYLGTEL